MYIPNLQKREKYNTYQVIFFEKCFVFWGKKNKIFVFHYMFVDAIFWNLLFVYVCNTFSGRLLFVSIMIHTYIFYPFISIIIYL